MTCNTASTRLRFVISALRQSCFIAIRSATAIWCAALIGCHGHQTYNVLASVLEVTGSVSLLHEGGKTSLSPASRVAAGDRIKTEEDGAAAISLIPGMFIETQTQTTFTITALKLSKDGDETADPMKGRSVELILDEGKIRAFLPKRTNGRCRLRIRTDSGTLEAKRDSVFSLQRNGDSSRIVCVHGKILWRARAGNSAMTIAAQQYVDTTPDGRAIGEPRATANDNGAEEEMEATIGAAGSLEQLERELRNRPAPWRKR